MPASDRIAVPITVRNLAGRPCTQVPVWTGVALPAGAVNDPSRLRLADAEGRPVPAQFDVQARWADGSCKWVLLSLLAGPEATAFVLTEDASLPAPEPDRPVCVLPDTHRFKVITGALEFDLNRHGFTGPAQVMLDVDGQSDRISRPADASGLVALDADGEVCTSTGGRVSKVEVERGGPIHAVVAVHGDLRGRRSDTPLLEYCMRLHAFAGSTLVRVVLTVRNPRPSGRADDGSRWVMGQSGAVLLKSLAFAFAPRLDCGRRTVTLSAEAGKLLDRIPMARLLGVYQGSSGGENWFHRTHVNRDNVMPVRFRGYRVRYGEAAIDEGLRASPWIESADTRWAVAAAVPAFWENFPAELAVEADGTIRVGLWPAEWSDLHEIQGGEQKTREFWLYFRHRRGDRHDPKLPYAREMMPVCLDRPAAWPSAASVAESGAIGPVALPRAGRFASFEALAAAAVRGTENLFTHRESADEYGWRHFGDTPAYNEADRTGGPYDGLRVVSHYNNEYDLGFTMLAQALRNADADPDLAAGWRRLGLDALWHEADIDIYHTAADPAPIYNGGTFTHTAHGVDAARSTHRGGPRDEVWGVLDWPWGRGSTPESGHLRNRGILLAWLMTGDRHLRDAAWEVTDLVAFKIGQDRFAQIDVPNRSAGHNLQILLDAWALTYEQRYLDLCRKVAANLAFDRTVERLGEDISFDWSCAIYLANLGRYVEALDEIGAERAEPVGWYLQYARAILDAAGGSRRRRSPWSVLLISDVLTHAAELTDDPSEGARFLAAAAEAFAALDDRVADDGTAPFWNSKQTTIMLHGCGRYMRHAGRQE